MSLIFQGKVKRDEVKKLPELPGVYFFLDKNDSILYIGRATVLRDRVRSYFSHLLLEARGPKVAKMLTLAESIGWRATDSVLEALILESRLIKEHQPPYNTDEKDDKSYNHIVITDESFPRVLVVRGRDMSEGKFVAPIRSLYGPFPQGGELREAVRVIRKIFPFREKCSPADGASASSGDPCFQRQIGLCPGVCTGEISSAEYRRTIRNIEYFFEGKKSLVIRRLEKEMKGAAEALLFEEAAIIRKRIFALKHIQDVSLLKKDKEEPASTEGGVRIEAYDAAHFGGKSSVGVMTVAQDNEIDKNEYRKFFLRGTHAGNDLSALGEILRRRLRHPEWRKPDIMVVDGNFLQLGVAEGLVKSAGWEDVALVGVVKNRKHQPERLIGDKAAIDHYRRMILLANAEAHRFAIAYHRKKRGQEFLPSV